MSQVCTKENPYNKENPDHKKSRWEHPDADYERDDYGLGGGVADGDYEVYNCPNCGLRFKVELPN